MITLSKQDASTSHWQPLERACLTVADPDAARFTVTDSRGWTYVDEPVHAGRAVTFDMRGAAGSQRIRLYDAGGTMLSERVVQLRPRTRLECDRGPYARLAGRLEQMLARNNENQPLLIRGRLHRMFVTWGRDHVHTLKAMKFFASDVQSGLDYWLDTQEPDGMFWDCIHPNDEYPGRTWFGEALGSRYFRYDDDGRWIVRRIPVEADCEFLYAEGVWQAWKASGDDAWMERQLPRLEAALRYMTHDPVRWSRKHKLVHRAMCMDSWDFINPLYCHGDHRGGHPDDPQFLFHGDNSGLYSQYVRMAEMWSHAGNIKRAAELRTEAEALRARANAALFFGNAYGHMIPETLPAEEVYAKVGDERRRISLSTGYTLNRGLPTHDMAVAVLNEIQRRGRRNKGQSFAEWWSMDPPYRPDQWPTHATGGSTEGDYMNGAISPLVAGELARAAFEHGMEAYGVDILERLWALSERDGGFLADAYRRLPDPPPSGPEASFVPVDLRQVVNRGLRHGATPGVEAWMGEGDNDLRGLPTGRQTFAGIRFDVVDPLTNGGRAVLRLDADPVRGAPASVEVPVGSLRGRSVYFLHVQGRSTPHATPVARYTVVYADGSEIPVFVRNGFEIGHWWGISDGALKKGAGAAVARATTRVAWRGANPVWANVGMHVYGWTNPKPETPVVAIRLDALQSSKTTGCVLVAGITFGDQPVQYEQRIRSFGLPACWSQAAVYHALAEGLAGMEDRGRMFDRVRLAPRWAATEVREAETVLHYPASNAYVACRVRIDRNKGRMRLDVAGAFDAADLHLLLPEGVRGVDTVSVDGEDVPFEVVRIGDSRYVDARLAAPPRGVVDVRWKVPSALRKGKGAGGGRA